MCSDLRPGEAALFVTQMVRPPARVVGFIGSNLPRDQIRISHTVKNRIYLLDKFMTPKACILKDILHKLHPRNSITSQTSPRKLRMRTSSQTLRERTLSLPKLLQQITISSLMTAKSYYESPLKFIFTRSFHKRLLFSIHPGFSLQGTYLTRYLSLITNSRHVRMRGREGVLPDMFSLESPPKSSSKGI